MKRKTKILHKIKKKQKFCMKRKNKKLCMKRKNKNFA